MSNQDRPRYRRNKTIGFTRKRWPLAKRIPAGSLIEFQYGIQKPLDEAGGWKHDRRPILIVFYDDQTENIEGINTNYLENTLLRETLASIYHFPGKLGSSPEDGKRLYEYVKTVEPDMLRAYRRYKRKQMKAIWLLDVDLSTERLFD